MSSEVPFGKYKGRPVEEMLADREYMAWLEAQPWFRERFGHLRAAKDEDAMSRTPVHNRLQALFLDADYRYAFCMAAAGNVVAAATSKAYLEMQRAAANLLSLEQAARDRVQDIQAAVRDGRDYYPRRTNAVPEHDIQSATQLADSRRAVGMAIKEGSTTLETVAAFECQGSDVLLRMAIRGPSYSTTGWGSWERPDASAKVALIHTSFHDMSFRIEIKPTVADEYPAVLRQMNRNKSEYLFVDSYQGEGATEAQFVAMFAASGKRVVFKRDVDAFL
jgi:hypothetical protein